MRICFIEDTHLHGGTQIWVAEAARAFLGRGENVTVLAPTDSWVAQQCAAAGARVVTYDWDEVISEDDRNIEIWTDALHDCDVALCTVHPPRQGFHCSVFAAHCIKLGNLKTHLIPKTGTIVPEYKREFYLPDESIRSSVIAIADFTRRYLITAYNIPEGKVALIYQGTDVRRFQPTEDGRREALLRYPLSETAEPVLGSIGSFEHRKGQPVIFESVSKLVAGALPNLHLMLVGDGPDEEMLKDKAKRMGLERNITLFPFTSEPDLVFERIDITVLSSLYKEGLPNVLLESMSMHVPVVSSNLGGVPEVVVDGLTGYMVEPGDSDMLANAIRDLWSDTGHYQEMSQNARTLMEESFDKEIQFDRFLKYFRTLL
ncbi:glycosyltransferase family 4 protein [Chloroflexota bacterium]